MVNSDRDFAIWALGALTVCAILVLVLPIPDKVWLIVMAALVLLVAGAFYKILGHTIREVIQFLEGALKP